jgi:nuclear transport factor 2 (NTF2) superfamily protein
MKSKQDLLIAAYRAFNARNIDTILAMMRPDVDWPNGMEGGRVNGRDNVREYWTRQWGILDPHVEPVGIEEDEGGRSVVRVHQVVRDLAGNRVVDQFVEHVYTIRDGLIERMDIREASSGGA